MENFSIFNFDDVFSGNSLLIVGAVYEWNFASHKIHGQFQSFSDHKHNIYSSDEKGHQRHFQSVKNYKRKKESFAVSRKITAATYTVHDVKVSWFNLSLQPTMYVVCPQCVLFLFGKDAKNFFSNFFFGRRKGHEKITTNFYSYSYMWPKKLSKSLDFFRNWSFKHNFGDLLVNFLKIKNFDLKD